MLPVVVLQDNSNSLQEELGPNLRRVHHYLGSKPTCGKHRQLASSWHVGTEWLVTNQCQENI